MKILVWDEEVREIEEYIDEDGVDCVVVEGDWMEEEVSFSEWFVCGLRYVFAELMRRI